MAWKTKSSASTYGPRGKGTIQINRSKGLVRVTLLDPKKVYTVTKDECPDVVQAWFDSKQGVPGNSYSISMKANGNEEVVGIFGIYPADGVFQGKVQKFAAPDDEAPTPKTNEKWGYQYFTVLVEISSPAEYKGMVVPATFRYNFTPIDMDHKGKTVKVVGISHPKSKYTPKLIEFLEIHKVTDKPMKFEDNILPKLEKAVLLHNVNFQFSVKDGWFGDIWDISGLVVDNKPEDEDDDWDDETEENGLDLEVEVENADEWAEENEDAWKDEIAESELIDDDEDEISWDE